MRLRMTALLGLHDSTSRAVQDARGVSMRCPRRGGGAKRRRVRPALGRRGELRSARSNAPVIELAYTRAGMLNTRVVKDR